jgi:hypothetical protein
MTVRQLSQRRYHRPIRKEHPMADLQYEIDAYQRMEEELKAGHKDRWVIVHDGQLVDSFESFELAANEAVRKFGRGPFLIRQVGAPPTTLPISVMYAWSNVSR